MEGMLIYNESIGRPDLILPDGKLLGGLHCGNCLEFRVNDQLSSGRLEQMEDWVIIINCLPTDPPYGQSVLLI